MKILEYNVYSSIILVLRIQIMLWPGPNAVYSFIMK